MIKFSNLFNMIRLKPKKKTGYKTPQYRYHTTPPKPLPKQKPRCACKIPERGLRAKIPSLYNDVITKDGLVLMTNEEINTIVDKVNSTGCTSFVLTSDGFKLGEEDLE